MSVRMIPNTFILSLLIGAIIWNTENFIRNGGLFLENILQFFLLCIIGYITYGKNSIGAGDIKLALVLSLFFFSFSSPLIFLGNTAVITIVFLFGYIIGGIMQIIGNEKLFQEMKILFHQKYQGIHDKYLSGGRLQIGKKFWEENRENIKNQFAIFLILIAFRFFITQFFIPEIPSLAILGTNTSLILSFYILSPLLYQYIQQHTKDIWWKLGFLIGITVFMSIQKNILHNLVFLFFQSIIFLGSFLLIFFILGKIISFFLILIDRKWVTINMVKRGDILNIHSTRYFWKNIGINDKQSLEKVFSENLNIAPPSFLQKDGDFEVQTADHEKFWGYISRIQGFPFAYISIQKTIPYGIFLIIGFLFTFYSHNHLAKMVIDTLRNILHL